MSSLNLHGPPEAGQGVETAAHDVTKNRSGRRWLAKRRPAECGLVPAKTKEALRSAPSPDENENAGGTPMTKSPDASNPRSDNISDQASRSMLALNPLVEQFGSIDVLVSGAAGNFLAPINGLSPNCFRVVVDIDLIGTFHVTRAAFPYLTEPGSASVINITAPQSFIPMRYQANVCAAKAGVDQLTQVLALEWGGDGIRVTSISPGPITGIKALQFLTNLDGLDADRIYRLVVRDTLQTTRNDNIFAIGDCACYVLPGKATPPGAQTVHGVLGGEVDARASQKQAASDVQASRLRQPRESLRVRHGGQSERHPRQSSVFLEGLFARLMYRSLYKCINRRCTAHPRWRSTLRRT